MLCCFLFDRGDFILDEKMDHYKQYPFEIYTITDIEEIINFNGL